MIAKAMDGFIAFCVLITVVSFVGIAAVKAQWQSSRRKILSSYAASNGFEYMENDDSADIGRFTELTGFSSLIVPAIIRRDDDLVFDFSGYGNGPGMVEWRQTVFAARLNDAAGITMAFMYFTTAEPFVNRELFSLCNYEDNRGMLLPDVWLYVTDMDSCGSDFVIAVSAICSRHHINVVIGKGMVFLFKQSRLALKGDISERLSLLHEVVKLLSIADQKV